MEGTAFIVGAMVAALVICGNFTLHDVAQGSNEWLALRSGRLTASVAKDMLAQIKSGEAAARRDLKARLATERLVGHPLEDGFVSSDMQRGTMLEPEARAAYAEKTGYEVIQVGFLAHNELMAGGSPDGIVVAEDLVLEIKAPKLATHIRYLLSEGGIPTEHLAQVRHLAWLTGCRCVDFVSYDPRLAKRPLYMASVCAEDLDLEGYDKEVRKFLGEVDDLYTQLAEKLEEAA